MIYIDLCHLCQPVCVEMPFIFLQHPEIQRCNFDQTIPYFSVANHLTRAKKKVANRGKQQQQPQPQPQPPTPNTQLPTPNTNATVTPKG